MRIEPADAHDVPDAAGRLVGGIPRRTWQLAPSDADLARAWFGGTPVDLTEQGAADLAHALLTNGLADVRPSGPEPTDRADTDQVTVVIPIRNEQKRLDATLRVLAEGSAGVRTIVVDDRSDPPIVVPNSPHVELVRIDPARTHGGPGPARNDGAAIVTTPVVAFVDAGVQVDIETLRRLAGWLRNDDRPMWPDGSRVVAVAPRLVPSASRSVVGRHEAATSPIDLGTASGRVGPERRITYLPGAVLIVDRAAFEAIGGFDPSLRYGEDVDLVWRLAERGVVRYDADETASYPVRGAFGSLVRRRYFYARGSAVVHARHGRSTSALRMSPWSAGFWAAALGRRPVVATALFVYCVEALRRRQPSPAAPSAVRESLRIVTVGNLWAGGAIARAFVGSHWPVAVALSLSRRTRRITGALVAAALVERLVSHKRVGHAGGLLLSLVERLVGGAGSWAGAWASGSVRPLTPDLRDDDYRARPLRPSDTHRRSTSRCSARSPADGRSGTPEREAK